MASRLQTALAALGTGLFGVAVVVNVASAQTPGFHLPGMATGSPVSIATALSADGRVVTGYSGGGNGFVWSETTGRYDFGFETTVGASLSAGISGDGTAVVGDGGDQAFRWRGPGTGQRLGLLAPYPRSAATGVSGDGSVVAGQAFFQTGFSRQAFRWTQATGMVGLGFTGPGHTESEAWAISRDGSTIVGYSADFGTGIADAFAWTQSTGMRVLPPLVPGSSAGAQAVNHDGSMIVGTSSSHGVMWTAAGIQDLGLAPGWIRSGARGVSDDGAVVLGSLSTATNGTVAVWTPATGFVPFLDYLTLNGISIPSNYTIRTVNAMSADGRTFCGDLFVGNTLQAYVVTVSAPASGALGLLMVACTARRTVRIRRSA